MGYLSKKGEMEKMAKSGIIDIDVYKSTILKEGRPQKEMEQVFNAYHFTVEKVFSEFNGKIWHQMGDGAICIFPTPIQAVDACIQLLDKLVEFNRQWERQLNDSPLFVRIGIHEIDSEDIKNVPENERGKFAHLALDVVGKLQKNCPIGKIAISMEVHRNLGVKRRLFRPSLVEFYGNRFFVLIDHLITPQEEKLHDGLSERQKKNMPPIPFLSWNRIKPEERNNLTTLDKFFEEPLLVILGETSSEPKGSISSAATSDAVGIMEVMAILKSHRDVRVGIDQWEDTSDAVLNRNIVIIGSGMVNIYAFALNDILSPVHFIKTRGRVLNQIVATSIEGEEHFGPHALPPKDSGLIIVSKSPFNLEKLLVWVAGITGMGTQAVTSFLKDLIVDAGSIWRRMGVPTLAYPIACVVGAKTRGTEDEWDLFDYYRRWRIFDYKALWIADANGNRVCT
jgi:hypothetical protein